MSLIAWSPMLSVGVKEIDDQHKKLVDMANKMNDMMGTGGGAKDVLGKLFVDLVQYTQYHFGTEERLMAQHAYAASDAHKKQHKDLVTQVADLKTRFDKGENVLTGQLMTFLRDWLTKHIMNTDKAFGRELNLKGVK